MAVRRGGRKGGKGRRVVAGTGRRVVAGAKKRVAAGAGALSTKTLDDRPIAIVMSRDHKRLLVTLPHELWVVNAQTLEIERSIEIKAERPSVSEASSDGQLWMGGHHLFRGNLYATSSAKVGSKLGGFVDRVCVLRPGLVCGAGSHGEILWSAESESATHRRKVGERKLTGLVATPRGRAIWSDGSQDAWVIDPDHPSGYMKLRLKTTSPVAVEREGIAGLHVTTTGRCVLAARDGALAWTTPGLRLETERFLPSKVAANANRATPLDLAGDARWIYVLRPRGLLQRFLIAQPPIPDDAEEPDPLPLAEECRLRWPASCMSLLIPPYASEDVLASALILGGPQADGLLGRLWRQPLDSLEWKPLELGARALVETLPPEAPRTVSFVATRSKLKGPGVIPLQTLRVDDVLKASGGLHITQRHGSLLERPVARKPAGEVMPGDAVLLPAMVRAREGTARPAMLLWPGVPDKDARPPEPQWLVWGDRPRGWMPVTTPSIRKQGWSRTDLFPWQVALARKPELAGNRAPLPEKWHDKDLFEALKRECKHLLKVIW